MPEITTEQYSSTMEKRLSKLGAKIDMLVMKAHKTKAELENKAGKLHNRQEAALDELKIGLDKAWLELSEAWTELRDASERAAHAFQDGQSKDA